MSSLINQIGFDFKVMADGGQCLSDIVPPTSLSHYVPSGPLPPASPLANRSIVAISLSTPLEENYVFDLDEFIGGVFTPDVEENYVFHWDELAGGRFTPNAAVQRNYVFDSVELTGGRFTPDNYLFGAEDFL